MTRMSKTLGTLLKERKYQNCNVKIGSKGGSGFWYCGKGELTFSLPAISQANVTTHKQTLKALLALQNRLDNLDLVYQEIYQKAKKKGIKNEKQYLEQLRIRQERERVSLPKKIASLTYDASIMLIDRPVREVVYGISPDEKPCWIIYVKGNEKGNYWTIAEYNKRRKNNDTNL